MKKIFVAIVEVQPIDGSIMAANMQQGYGEESILDYLRHKLPAGSPVTILSTHEVGVETVLATTT